MTKAGWIYAVRHCWINRKGTLNHHPAVASAIEEVAVVAEVALAVAEEADGMVNTVTDHLGKNASKNRIPT